VFELNTKYSTLAWEYRYALPVFRQKTTDTEHPWNYWRKVVAAGNSTVVDMGSDFTTEKAELRFNPPWMDLGYLSNPPIFRYSGHVIPSWIPLGSPIEGDVKVSQPMKVGASVLSIDFEDSPTFWGSLPSDSDEELAILGSSLIGKLAPTAPHNNVFTTLGEPRNDGLPSIPFLSFLKKGNIPKNAGGEYLNYQFGIAPTISDVKNILKTVRTADKLWKQYLRDSGRLVRRRFDMDPQITTTTESRSASAPWFTQGGMWSRIGPVQVVTKTEVTRSFSAAYMYYVDESSLSGMDGWLERAQYLYGWKPSPSGVYNLTAWSWLLDWFTNTGDVIDNISLYLEDPFLTRWAYIMEKSVVTKSYAQTLTTNTGQSITLTAETELVRKKRRRVSPLHLGFKSEALNGHQLAILAALGLTKGRNPGSM
jgi:hypothetical protein